MYSADSSASSTQNVPSIYIDQYLDGVHDILADLDRLKDAEDARQTSMEHPYWIRKIFSDHPECWSPDGNVVLTKQQEKTAWCIANCKTRGMNGFSAVKCTRCGYSALHYKSCGNRNCPSCQLPMQMEWVADRTLEVIPGQPYYHFILTCDHRLNPLFRCNQKLLVSLFFSSCSSAIIELSKDPHYLGAVPGIISVLHSWQQNLLPHWHLHCIVSGCGLTDDKQFVSLIDVNKARHQKHMKESEHAENDTDVTDCIDEEEDNPVEDSHDPFAGNDYFLPVSALMNLFRNKFMDGIRKYWEKGQLVIPAEHPEWQELSAWSEFCRSIADAKWVGKLVKAFHGQGKTNAIDYLARYVFRTAISNNRIVAYDGKNVTFTVRDNDHPGKKKQCALSAEEFIHRFLLHIPEKNISRVRYSGFLCNAQRAKNLHLIAVQLNNATMLKNWPGSQENTCQQNKSVLPETCLVDHDIQPKHTTATAEELMMKYFSRDICQCPVCKGALIVWPPRRNVGIHTSHWSPEYSKEKEKSGGNWDYPRKKQPQYARHKCGLLPNAMVGHLRVYFYDYVQLVYCDV